MFITLAAVLAAVVATGIFDVRMTEAGLKAGVAVEGNTFLVGQKPSARALYLRDSLVTFASALPSLLAMLFHSQPFFYAGLILPVVYAVNHVRGGLGWRKLLKK